jgi:hypothetical protein
MAAASRANATRDEVLTWYLLVSTVTTIGSIMVIRAEAFVLGVPLQLLYVLAHVCIMTFSFRRLYGLVRARWAPPSPDRRIWTPVGRILHGVAVLLVVYAQIPLALLFGMLGPNPANDKRQIVVKRGEVEFPMLMIAQASDRIIGFNTDTQTVVSIPLDTEVIISHATRKQSTQPGRSSSDR